MMTPDEIAHACAVLSRGAWTHHDVDADGNEVMIDRTASMTRLAAALAAERERTEKAEADLNKVYMDERGVTWCRPTAWAYAQTCRVRDEHLARAEKAETEAREWREACLGHGEKARLAEARAERAEAERDRLIAALTPSAETKAAYIGEFSFTIMGSREDEDGEQIDYEQEITVPWDTVKNIMKAIRAYAADKPQEGE